MNQHPMQHRVVKLLLGCSLVVGLNVTVHSRPLAAQSTPNPVLSADENFQNGNLTLAIQQWSQDIFQGKNLTNALYNRSQAYILIQQPQLALNDLDKLISIQGNSTRAEVFLVRGVALTELNQLDLAIASFNQAEILTPTPSPLLYNNRALTYQKLGQMELAIADLEQSVRFAPLPINRVNLANARIQQGQFDQAIADMNQVIAQQNTFFPAYSTRGIAQYHLGQYEAALLDFLTSLSLVPTQPEAYHYAGLSLAALGRTEDAKENLMRAANLYLQENQPEFYQQILEDISALN